MATITASYTHGSPRFGNDNSPSNENRWQTGKWSSQPMAKDYSKQSPSSQPRIDLGNIPHGKNINTTQVEGEDDGLDSKWIHRDKLAKIESQELAEIGIQLGITDRIIGHGSTIHPSVPLRSHSQLNDSISRQEFEAVDTQLPSPKRIRTVSGSVEVNDRGGQSYARQAQVHGSPSIAPSPVRTRKTGVSRIPVSKSSPAQKTQADDGEDSPIYIPRRGSIKNARNSLERMSIQKARKHSTSTSESDVADQPTGPGSPELKLVTHPSSRPNSTSYPKNRSVSEGVKFPNSNRITSNQQRPRNVSAPLKPAFPHQPGAIGASRPGTSSGPRQPINRPDGEAPWIATMFKPDPMLPQDQQIIPTHAKRLAIEHGQFVPTIEPFDLNSQEASIPPEHSIVPSVAESTDQRPENVEHELAPRSRTSLRNRFRSDVSISGHSQDDSVVVTAIGDSSDVRQDLPPLHDLTRAVYVNESVDQPVRSSQKTQQAEPGPVTAHTQSQPQTEEWPLQTSSIAMGELVRKPSNSALGSPQRHEMFETGFQRLESAKNIAPKEQLSALPNAVSISSRKPANVSLKPTRIPEAPVNEKNEKKEKSCGFCIVM